MYAMVELVLDPCVWLLVVKVLGENVLEEEDIM
jgi:hypothetical protein